MAMIFTLKEEEQRKRSTHCRCQIFENLFCCWLLNVEFECLMNYVISPVKIMAGLKWSEHFQVSSASSPPLSLVTPCVYCIGGCM